MGDFTFDFTLDKCKESLQNNKYAEHWFEVLTKYLPNYKINTPERVACFIGQTMVESAKYTRVIENLNYRAETLMKEWPSHFPTLDIANKYAHRPQAIANRAYANRMGNGSEESEDGWKYCGRGLIQITGKDNYTKFADSINIYLDDAPELMTTFDGCVQSAGWFWTKNKLNELSDNMNVVEITNRVNGGSNGLNERQLYTDNAYTILQG